MITLYIVILKNFISTLFTDERANSVTIIFISLIYSFCLQEFRQLGAVLPVYGLIALTSVLLCVK